MSFNLRAHHTQAQTVRSRWHRAQHTYELLDEVASGSGLSGRVIDALYSATLGFRLRRPMYVQQTGVDTRTASRGLRTLTDLGLLRPVGQTKGRHYVAGPRLDDLRATIGRAARPVDPYPQMVAELALRAARGRSGEASG